MSSEHEKASMASGHDEMAAVSKEDKAAMALEHDEMAATSDHEEEPPEPKWQYKIVESLPSEPDKVKEAFEQPTGWYKLGPSGCTRCQDAWESPYPGKSFFLTLSPMCSYKMVLVGVNECGLTLVRTTETKENRLLAKRVVERTVTYSVTLEAALGKTNQVLVKAFTLAGTEVVSVQKRKNTLWKEIWKHVRYVTGHTDQDWVEFMLGNQRLTKRFADRPLSEELKKDALTKKARKTISKGQ